MTQRTDRIDELLRQEMTSILARDVDDPRIGFATITDVETAPDLRHARVLVSVIGQPADRTTTLTALGRAMPFVRHELGKRLRLRRIPEFHLELDDTIERGTRVLQLLDELEAGGGTGDREEPGGETLPTPVARLRHGGDAEDPPPSVSRSAPRRGEGRCGGKRSAPGRRRR